MDPEYQCYKEIFRDSLLPLAYVDLDRFDKNVQDVLKRAGKMNICVASKSIRCVAMIKRVMEASPRFHAIMAYCAREAVFLAGHGLDNILIAYPLHREVRHSGLCELLKQGKRITLMVDSPEHVDHLNAIGDDTGATIPLCIDLDMSTSFPGLHFGVRRSPVRTVENAVQLWQQIKKCKHVRLDGLMGYEAQIAGLQDHAPGSFIKKKMVPLLKSKSLKEVIKRRADVVNALKAEGAELRFVNGGGTGSVETTTQEEVVTEVTVGSGFFSPTLFDHYAKFKHLPAAGFAIEVVRQPTDNIYTCHGGGYIASGPAGVDRLPKPYLPQHAELLPLEGAGEVQTPIQYKGAENIQIGDPIFFRHGKAGEICERFNSLHCIKDEKIVDEVPTYRGEGKCFL